MSRATEVTQNGQKNPFCFCSDHSRVSDQVSVTTYTVFGRPHLNNYKSNDHRSCAGAKRRSSANCVPSEDWPRPKLWELQQEMCHRPIIANPGRVCQISVDRFSSIDKSVASCHDWGAVPSNLPLSNVQILDTSANDIVGSRDYTRHSKYIQKPKKCGVSQPPIVLDPLSWRISKSCVDPSHTEHDTLILVANANTQQLIKYITTSMTPKR